VDYLLCAHTYAGCWGIQRKIIFLKNPIHRKLREHRGEVSKQSEGAKRKDFLEEMILILILKVE
jgi:hypothetical protein